MVLEFFIVCIQEPFQFDKQAYMVLSYHMLPKKALVITLEPQSVLETPSAMNDNWRWVAAKGEGATLFEYSL